MILQAIAVFGVVVAAQILLVAKAAKMLSSARTSVQARTQTTDMETFWAADLRL